MDLAESRSSLKRRGGVKKNPPVSHPVRESPLKIQRHLVQLLAIKILIASPAMIIHLAVGMGKMWCICTYIATSIIMQFPISGKVACAFGYRKKTFWLLKIHCAIGNTPFY